MLIKYIVTIAIVVLVVSPLNAQDLTTVESERNNQKILRELDSLETDAKVLARSKIEITTDDCFAALGHRNFCKCLGEKLPMSVSFQDYVGLVSMTKFEIMKANSGLDSSDLLRLSRLVDKTRQVRDKCVNDNFQ